MTKTEDEDIAYTAEALFDEALWNQSMSSGSDVVQQKIQAVRDFYATVGVTR